MHRHVVCRLAGIAFGYCIARAFDENRSVTKFSMCVTGFSHTTSIQLLLVHSLADLLSQLKPRYSNPEMEQESSLTAYDRGIYYVVLSASIAALWNWSVAYMYRASRMCRMLGPTEEQDPLRDPLLSNSSLMSGCGSDTAHSPIVAVQSLRLRESRMYAGQQVGEAEPEPEKKKESRPADVWDYLANILNMPTIVCIVSIVLASITAIQARFVMRLFA
ncbi:MAG: hypothetical protein P4M11_15220 [Candidatus Pacebacteria bacterium]|nr:hypothetical protein [Candidatus Paceibacterota bacterium]